MCWCARILQLFYGLIFYAENRKNVHCIVFCICFEHFNLKNDAWVKQALFIRGYHILWNWSPKYTGGGGGHEFLERKIGGS